MYSNKKMTIRKVWTVERVEGCQSDQSDVILGIGHVGARNGRLYGAITRGDVWEVYVDLDTPDTVFVLTFSRSGLDTCGVTEYRYCPVTAACFETGWRIVEERSYFAQEHQVREILGADVSELTNPTIFRRLLEYAHDRY